MDSEKQLSEIKAHVVALHAHMRVMSAVLLARLVPQEEFQPWLETVEKMETDLRRALVDLDPDSGDWPDLGDWWRRPPGLN